MNNDRLEMLLDAYFDENLNAEQGTELNYLLLSSPKARELFWDRARFHALLRRYGTENWGAWLAEAYGTLPQETDAPHVSLIAVVRGWFSWVAPRASQYRWALGTGFAALALAAAIGMVFLRLRAPLPKPVVEHKELVVQPAAAELVRAVNVEWSDSTNRAEPGAVLTAGPLRLKRGLVEIEFYRGARVVLEGPADFEIISDMEARCLSGKIRVEVPPPAHGFKVYSPTLNVIDVGTSFGMKVRPDGEAEVHVFKGKVEMAGVGERGLQKALIAGESARVDGRGQMRALNEPSVTYLSHEDVEHQARAEMERRYRAWQDYSRTLSKDPSLLLYYDFEEGRSDARTLVNRVPGAALESSGTIIGCQWAEGRWPGKAALDFKQFGDRVRFTMPGRLSSMTCMTWIRLDGLGHSLNALMMAGGARAGELQWQLLQTGEILFGKRVLDGWGEGHLENFRTQPVLKPEQMGLWMHLAVVYDMPSGTVHAYLNGRNVLRREIQTLTPMILDSLEVGNWTPQLGQPIEPIRNFNGRLDELLIFGRALSPQEIRANHEIGRPL